MYFPKLDKTPADKKETVPWYYCTTTTYQLLDCGMTKENLALPKRCHRKYVVTGEAKVLLHHSALWSRTGEFWRTEVLCESEMLATHVHDVRYQ